MTYRLFIQVIRDGQPENLFFDTLEALTSKKVELDAEIEAGKTPEAVPQA